MKISELWLREWVNPTINSLELCNKMAMAGLEVNNIEPVSPNFHSVLIGEVIKCVRHPRSNRLYMTTVNTGAKSLLSIICSASNCREGLKVAVAPVGAILPGNYIIRKIELQGETSEGILCSFSQLGIPIKKEGIIELPLNASVGTDLSQYLQLKDNIIDIGVTPNRADCLSIMGIARDISVASRAPLYELKVTPAFSAVSDVISIRVNTPEDCPRYLARIIKEVNIQADTPLWMQEKLRRCGINSLNSVLDITNYVLLELGQPINVFDFQAINGGLSVRYAKEEESLVCLEKSKVKLDSNTLVIADEEKILAMAGITISKDASVTIKTKSFILESAFFRPLSIVGRARRYGLHSDTAFRFERGVDFNLQYKAIERATSLLLTICGGSAGPVINITNYSALPSSKIIKLYRKNLDRLIGYCIPNETVTDILERLGFTILTRKDYSQWKVVVPSWRFDIDIEVDLVREVMRIYGYSQIPNIPVQANLMIDAYCKKDFPLQRVKALLIDKGYQEAITYSFVDPKIQSILHPQEESLRLLRPVSRDMSVMRLSLFSGLLGAVLYNQNRQQLRIRLFESGLRFVPDIRAPYGIRQELMLSAVISGNRYSEHWDLARSEVDFYDLKGDLESIFDMLHKLHQIKFIREHYPAFHPGQCAAMYINADYIGCIGVLHPEIERNVGIRGRTIVFELIWNKISEYTVPHVLPVSRFPANRRDISVIVAEYILAGDVLEECKKVRDKYITGIYLFDVYRGNKVASGCKSLTISITVQALTRTLEDHEISNTIEKCIKALKNRFGAKLRV
ncbi:phenylalanine--tRNA ligase subunit beta [Candidatus Erwinia haradaeae]|uniref:Phenylalanine--tRNA ligase beta subunit n=1 Tax=Candidatus Erwinia haradaeae TaxID=1922217 RepID=A0A451D3E8_9GAMM|nr:phenylalanine--tRNA ligase subunit beta [Candidatus Erwinia haradaeae]VFP80172.1 Phenylalanine--tRNA ligase beta subunit [Candidatus Erwinia haradaeae]